MSTERQEAEDLATRYRQAYGNKDETGKVVTITPDTECATCSGGVHRFRMHSGPRLTCQMAACNCKGFIAKAEEAPPVTV